MDMDMIKLSKGNTGVIVMEITITALPRGKGIHLRLLEVGTD